jgi:CheY-like chemotaxis protein
LELVDKARKCSLPFDVILLDLDMKIYNGFEVYSKIDQPQIETKKTKPDQTWVLALIQLFEMHGTAHQHKKFEISLSFKQALEN